jgi:hypothetical protein
MKTSHGTLGLLLAWIAPMALPAALGAAEAGRPSLVDHVDPEHGSRIRQVRDDQGHEHNLYYYRDPWNADGSRMLSIRSDLDQKNWRVGLYDGDGVYLKDLYTIDQYDWRACWDRTDPNVLYTTKASALYRYNVNTGTAELLKDLAPKRLSPAGPSLNQAGDRVLLFGSDRTFYSYRLRDMGEERTFKLAVPPGATPHMDKARYLGFGDCIDTAYSAPGGKGAIVVYEDSGKLIHTFDGIGGGGHYDFSPQGKLAYLRLPGTSREANPSPFEIHVVDLDGKNDRVLYSLPAEKCHFQNLHLSWPRHVNDWFVASFFPSTFKPAAPKGAVPLDEILQFRLDGTTKFLGHTQTIYSRATAKGAAGDMFWAQPLARPSADGKRICFNSNRSGTIDIHILYTDAGPAAPNKE